MQHISISAVIIAIMAFLISWSWQLGSAYRKVIKREDDVFNWSFYFRQNIVDILSAFFSVFLLLLLFPWLMDQLGFGSSWSDPMAAICGILNVQLVKLGKKLFEKGIEKKTGEKLPEQNSDEA
jgi:hypothetical protein